jgi:hypothetical protein
VTLRKYIATTILLVLSGFVGCQSHIDTSRVFVESDRYSFSEFLESIDQFPYLAEDSKVKQVKEGYDRLVVGMSKEDCVAMMGEPDSEMLEYAINNEVREFSGSTFGYYLARYEAEWADSEYDSQVALYFDKSHRLYFVLPSNVEGLVELGHPVAGDR